MTYTQIWDHMNNKVHDYIIVRDADNAFIPFDEGNMDYQEYLAWLEEGNKPTPAQLPAMPGQQPSPDQEPEPEPKEEE
jgi:hypothetical protein